ncbi:hypothetical protein ZIOFF_035644 [Zingiber officinale]|uniref:DM2 domain-containing protein n=1 Tax=Zingiber officinale TaxID=94328 RepID=A0A8J5KXV1_ZINOF|nr:hypothetical protein ZIOFF_035644 [Zingiber officinale]
MATAKGGSKEESAKAVAKGAVKPKGAFHRPLPLSPAMSKFLSIPEITLVDAIKKIWEHIKENQLQGYISLFWLKSLVKLIMVWIDNDPPLLVTATPGDRTTSTVIKAKRLVTKAMNRPSRATQRDWELGEKRSPVDGGSYGTTRLEGKKEEASGRWVVSGCGAGEEGVQVVALSLVAGIARGSRHGDGQQ